MLQRNASCARHLQTLFYVTNKQINQQDAENNKQKEEEEEEEEGEEEESDWSAGVLSLISF